jgi:two-component system, OmpR family, sensor kinase
MPAPPPPSDAEAREAFLGRVAHDLRGELATMVAGVHYLRRYEGGVSDPGKQMLERVDGAAGRLKRLLDELEHAGWIGGMPPGPLTREPCHLADLVTGALSRIERIVTQRNVAVRVDVPDDLPPFDGDPEISGAALEYVIDFAVSRSPGRAVLVRADGPDVVTVTDEGGPLDGATLAGLLEPFAEKAVIPRPEPGTRRRERLGLGLAIARGILAAEGGSLRAATSPGGEGVALTCAFARG